MTPLVCLELVSMRRQPCSAPSAATSAEGTSVSPSVGDEHPMVSILTTPSEFQSTSLTGARMSREPASEPGITSNARALSAWDASWVRLAACRASTIARGVSEGSIFTYATGNSAKFNKKINSANQRIRL